MLFLVDSFSETSVGRIAVKVGADIHHDLQ